MLNVVGQLTATTLDVSRNDVADRAIGKSHNKSSLENYQSRSLMLSNCSASNDRRSCALVFVTVPGVEPFTDTAAALALFAAVLAAALFAASASACRPLWTASKSSGFKRIAFRMRHRDPLPCRFVEAGSWLGVLPRSVRPSG